MPFPRSALVLGSSGAIGAALADHLRSVGCAVETRSRSTDGLDLTIEDSVRAHAQALAGRQFDWIIVCSGVLAVDGVDPERAFRQLDPDVMARSYLVNTIGPALALKHFAALLPRDRPAVFAALSARLGSIGDNRLGGWMSYRASKAALNQVLRCASVELSRKRPQTCVVALHPGTVPSPMTERYARGRYTADPPTAAAQLTEVLLGVEPRDTGCFLDYAGEVIPF